MGIVNCTQDSFYSASRSFACAEVCHKIDELVNAGADIIDIGGKSTRPGSLDISTTVEIERITDAIAHLAHHHSNVWGSIDTTSAEVAHFAIEKGLHMVNDISGGDMDAQMIPTVAMLGVPFVCTHMQGTPQTMQENPQYLNVTEEVYSFFFR